MNGFNILRKPIPLNILYELLEKICLKTKHYYRVDKVSFRKMIFLGLFNPFVSHIIEYYHSFAQNKILRDVSYASFLTLLRQICSSNHITIGTHHTHELGVIFHIPYT